MKVTVDYDVCASTGTCVQVCPEVFEIRADGDLYRLIEGDLPPELRAKATEAGSGVVVVGPAPAYIARRADRWRFNLVLRGADPASMLGDGVEAPGSVDVDPESLL